MSTNDAHGAMTAEYDIRISKPAMDARRLITAAHGAVISYLRNMGRECRAILSVCTGSFLMQKAGLLRGRRATTHWACLDHLRNDPDVTMVEQRFMHDGNVWTAGGVSAGMDMMLAFIADSLGETVAAEVQLAAEYFPEGRIYGQPFEQTEVSRYIREMSSRA